MARRIGAKREHSSSPVSMAALLLCNLVLIVGMIVAAVIYSRGITQQRYNIKKGCVLYSGRVDEAGLGELFYYRERLCQQCAGGGNPLRRNFCWKKSC